MFTMKNYFKKIFIILLIAIIDYICILAMRALTPAVFSLRLALIGLITLISFTLYFYIIKASSLLKECIFVSTTLLILSTTLIIIQHGIIGHSLHPGNFLVSLIAVICPVICAIVYKGISRY